jgi:hypothetical protein
MSLVGNVHLEDRDGDGRISVRRIFGRLIFKMGNGWNWVNIVFKSGLWYTRSLTFGIWYHSLDVSVKINVERSSWPDSSILLRDRETVTTEFVWIWFEHWTEIYREPSNIVMTTNSSLTSPSDARLTLLIQCSPKYYSRIQSVPQRKHHTSPLQRSIY